MKNVMTVLIGSLLLCSVDVSASETITTEPNENSYNFVSSYSVLIDAPAEVVWPHLRNLGAWMYEFEMSNVSGEPGQLGEVMRLYEGQDFLVQIIEAIPQKLLVMANLPSGFKGEKSTGIGVTTLTQIESATRVTLTMSRRYTWTGEGENTQKLTRQSQSFREDTKARWVRFLKRLKLIAEQSAPDM